MAPLMTCVRLVAAWCAAILMLVAACPSLGQGGTIYKVFYLGGQSNMEGYGMVDELPADLREPLPDVLVFQGNTAADADEVDGRGIWAPLQPGHGAGFSSDGKENLYSERFGPELTFARRLRELMPADRIAIVKYARGGTSIDVEAPGSGTWDPDYDSGNGINQYDHFLATLRHAWAAGDIDGDGLNDTLVPAGIIWMQGETDAGATSEIAERYETHLGRLMEIMRAAMRVDDLPVVIGRISDSGDDEDGLVWDHGAVVRQAQESYARTDRRATLVTATDEYAYSDTWHYNTQGYLDLGAKFAEAYVRILSGRP